MPDWPQDKPPPYVPPDDEGLVLPPGHYQHGEFTPETHPALFAAIAEAFGPAPVPPPDVWEFYRRHGRWPIEGEA